ncbi:hypothetical protein [Streptomyces sp. CB03234]|uniref:hypothetical protein n=1 Tax=Streptomyces sp. (strain CB03234) TaxID=1703937 RepID=UPI00093D57AB|nr:hypothetical protein [Streptomyces sp. CB03234]
MAGSDGGGKKDLEVGGVTLQDFRTRMQELLTELDASPAQHRKIGEQKITADAYGQGFGAATALHGAYEQVRSRLEELTRVFGETIEGMGIAVHFADKGYANVDIEEKERFEAIQKRVEEHGAAYSKDGAKTQPSTHTNTGDSGGFS